MPPLPKYRKAKRPTVLVIRSQRSRKSLVSKSRSIIYEQVKANNIALAKALSKEKQECHYLFTQNLHLTSQLQERDSSISQRDAAMRGILKNSSELLAYLVESTDRVTRTIAACQQFVGIHRVPTTPSPSAKSAARRESTRRSTAKSPARGVVQPMVSGHTITKPVINLSRINAPRIRTSPNLSDIEETLSSPESNQSRTETTSNLRIVNSIRNPPNILTRRVEGLLPERIRLTSPRISDETERISDRRSRRLSDRHSGRHSRKFSRNSELQMSPNQSRLSNRDTSRSSRSSEGLHDIRNPRVALEDVSKLLQKSQSLNVKILLDSSELEQNNSNVSTPSAKKRRNTTAEDTQQQELAAGTTPMDDDDSPTYNFDPRVKEMKKTKRPEDPLEGPSWAYNNLECADFYSSSNSSADNSLLSDVNSPANTSNSSVPLKTAAATLSRKSRRKTSSSKWQKNSCQWSSPSSDDDEANDDEKCQNVSQLLNSYNSSSSPCNPPDLTRLPEHVTRRRGQPQMDDDDLTLLLNRQRQVAPEPFDMSELELPNLEMPLVNPEAVEPEPEITTTVRMLTQTIHRMPSMCVGNMSVMGDKSSVMCPDIGDSVRLSTETEDEITQELDEDETAKLNKALFKRKRVVKNRLESTSSDSESSASPKKILAQNNVTRRRDPGSAKVVLEKLDSNTPPRKPSYGSRAGSCANQLSSSMQSDVHSDSENSNASSKVSSTRPRRNKAPANLAEPKLNTKLRR